MHIDISSSEELVREMTMALNEAIQIQKEAADTILKLKEENEKLIRIIIENGLEEYLLE